MLCTFFSPAGMTGDLSVSWQQWQQQLMPQGEGSQSFLLSQLTHDYLGSDVSEEACLTEGGEKWEWGS